jgi:hypothetical protein
VVECDQRCRDEQNGDGRESAVRDDLARRPRAPPEVAP